MKRGLLCIAAALVLAAGALWLASLRNYDAADAVEENGVLLYLRKDHGAAFASTYRWDGTGDAIDYVIPDTVQGVKVTAIGGLTGELKKVPTAGLAITMPETYRGAERAHYTMPSGAVEITLPVHIHIGRYVRSVQPDGSLPTPTGYFGYDKGVSSYIITPVWTVTCDEGNETYYARDGRLYQRADNALVQLPYAVEGTPG